MSHSQAAPADLPVDWRSRDFAPDFCGMAQIPVTRQSQLAVRRAVFAVQFGNNV
jgi:hypothetical protein